MLILLDCSPKKIKEYSLRYDYEFGQLRTPLTRYKWAERPYGIDNGAYTNFDFLGWVRLIEQSKNYFPEPLFITMPDIVGSAVRTLELYDIFSKMFSRFKRALVMQDGIEKLEIPWDNLEAIFIGGTDEFKESRTAKDCCKTARILNKWVHVGRVNTSRRVREYAGFADSIDGSGLSKYDHMLEKVLQEIRQLPPEQRVSICNLSYAKTGQ